MAAKLVGGAYLSSFVDTVLNKLSSIDVNATPTARKLADKRLLQKLRKSLRATRPVLDDAEQKQIRDQEVKKWLVDLQDALYMADDLLDELSAKAATPTQRDPGNSSSWSHYVDSILEDGDDDEMGVVTRMQDIVDKLESIVEEKDDLDLKQGVAKDLEDMSWRIQSSLIESSDIYGRNGDKEAIIKLLFEETCDDKLSVISIEGIGGIGKTTLAQLVYNDARVKEKFAIKAWVCVATRFDPISDSKAMIEEITSSPCDMVNLNSLQTQLKEKLNEKTFLVVLDDVWDNQQNLWDNFLKPFLSGNKGNYQFDKEELILLWMAEDFVQPIENCTLENIGRAYFDELVARSFFQPSSKDVGLFVMHDLMHDLATFFAGKFYFKLREFEDSQKICSKTRHLSYTANPDDRILKLGEAYKGATHMRTFLDVHLFHRYGSINLESDSWLLQLHLRCLRVLSFKYFSIESLPDSIEKLIHLHYLNLSHTPIVRLSESLCKLYNLQTLKLCYCKKLEMLPSRMKDLVSLRHLDIKGADSLKEMPKGMSKLNHLNFLSGYVVGKHEENGIRELGALGNLHGSLCISNLENVSNSREVLEAKMGNKKHINILELKWLPDGDIVDVETERDILDKLQPHRNLKGLSIVGFRGEIFPDWLGLGLSCYSNMTKLVLSSCKNCCQVPSLGQLPSLQHLEFFEIDGLERVGCEFYKNNESFQQDTPFKALQSLKFKRMRGWRKWHIPDEIDVFPKLKSLSIRDCPVLSGDLSPHLPALEQLTIWNCEELACSLPRAPKLHQLTVKGSGFYLSQEKGVLISETQLAKSVLEWLPHIQSPRLQHLEIKKCWSAISISGDYLPDSLQILRIQDCSKLTISEPLQHKSLKEIHVSRCDSLTLFALGSLPNLEALFISKCHRLISMPGLGFADLEKLVIAACPEMDCFGEECLPPKLTTLHIAGCEKLERWITSKGLHSEGLTDLTLGQWNEVKSFPKEGCLPVSLQSLQLLFFPNLETLDCKGLRHLTSLQELSITGCSKLENITEERAPASIAKFVIGKECPLSCKLEEMNDPRIQLQSSFIGSLIRQAYRQMTEDRRKRENWSELE
ncbi:putative disease resistance protein At3g14460 [Arachis hypogaea]|uniref:putative disease resistance protein At3g14460 n=1 Tax=Arachis hypogaea TaxID=3818 RepID=UPI000DEC382F|nr:putative disease resistance protein At3g14460 [Arachis hypogaea]